MKKYLCFALSLCFLLTACVGGQGGGNAAADPQTDVTAQPPEPADGLQPPEAPESAPSADGSDSSAPEAAAESNILIAYFTYGENAALPPDIDAMASASIQYRGDALTGNTGLIAGMIADATGGELFPIRTAEPYPDNYADTLDTGQAELSSGARPELASHLDSLESYDIVFLGFPNWWGDMPMAVYSFLDEYDFNGKTIVPFVTSGSSGFSDTLRVIGNTEPDAFIADGLSIRSDDSPQAEADVIDWLALLGLTESK